jgi:hypothetical protein
MSGNFTSGYLQEVTGDLDGPPCHVCGAIMARKHKEHCGDKAFRKRTEPLGVYVEMPCDCGRPWTCLSCGEMRPS